MFKPLKELKKDLPLPGSRVWRAIDCLSSPSSVRWALYASPKYKRASPMVLNYVRQAHAIKRSLSSHLFASLPRSAHWRSLHLIGNAYENALYRHFHPSKVPCAFGGPYRAFFYRYKCLSALSNAYLPAISLHERGGRPLRKSKLYDIFFNWFIPSSH